MDSVDDVLRLVRYAQERRRVSETRMNKASSRSHCLFSIHVTTVEEEAGLRDGVVHDNTITRSGSLHLCDLAGEAARAGPQSTARRVWFQWPSFCA